MWYWYLIVSAVIFMWVAWKVPKPLPPLEYYATVTTCLFIAEVTDRWTDRYSIYEFWVRQYIDIPTTFMIFFIYAPAAVIIISLYPFNGGWIKRITYILAWSIFSSFYEWTYLKMGYLYYPTWKWWYSAISYPFLYGFMFCNLKFVQWVRDKYRKTSVSN
jgi:hypothetical protein